MKDENINKYIVPYFLFVIYLTIMAIGINIWGILSIKRQLHKF
ncbi:hypothetical protein CPAST_c09010 [Clostridium pasteurianum DSM 525 = ATCC 6013]|uniref:Uncharacterized protein n=1 Tax=Clostridium pasteurianum DSM 525 = ATCC 6013 TaxID=1262449 RepID=A0A0H3IZN5_CLOPA|nr:hypothetical protein [Clostridium pasteurianum]AJA47001.1 hypothetical protein CPAST_c09010 [Clostridium pasteurianum DSM 525 = ATCC 6013]AJA50989.1 hypothetical protein CLPA_c09010 [Clostridium pasteurianum DSM 525 = ATCC 6013]KRU13002.1 hypothetical protein CP6013_02250 [Clostridium pasteurianum DSM 525 = ATCC 6013]